MAGDDIIDESVVRISPDLTGFRPKLRAALKTATEGIEAKVRLVADGTGWAASVRKTLATRAQPSAKVTLVADTRGLDRMLRAASRERTLRVKVKADETQSVREVGRALSTMERLRGRSEQKQTAITRQGEAQRRRIRGTANPILKASEANGIIDFGGSGLRPTNALLAAAVLLSPALLAVASSATLASTSIAAMGAASIGAAGAITAVVVGFTRIREALTLREQVRKEEARSTASTAENTAAERNRNRAIVAGNRAVRDSMRGLVDARRSAKEADRAAAEARAAVNVAYRDAAQYVKDLREELSDLALQERQDTLDVAGAKERLATVNNNYWATDLERRQAALDVQKALDDQGDTKRDQAAKRKELNKLDREGLGQSKQVLEARKQAAAADRAAADAQRGVVRAQEQVADAQAQVVESKRADVVASTAVSAASQDLAAKIAALSPAAREMYYWFERNTGMFDKLRSKMEAAVLPGFLTFLEAITDRGRGASTLDILADGAARLGRVIGGTVGELGEMSKLPWFRKDMRKVNTENEKSFKLLGRAALTLVSPLLKITAVSSPLFTRFSGWLLKLTEQFSAFIDKADRNGSLVKWFRDAGDEAAKWGGILGNLLGFLKSIFTASLPSGKDLVTRIGDATAALDNWAKNPKGKAQLEKFFKFFQDIDYEKIRNFVVQFGAVIAALKLFTFGRKHPFWAFITLLAASDLEASANLLAKVSGAMLTVLGWIEQNPKQAAVYLAILTAMRYQKTATIGLKLLGLGGLGDTIAKAFGKTTTVTMNVTAGVVNVVGGTGGAPGAMPAAGSKGAAAAKGGGKLATAAKGILPFLSALTSWPVLAVAVGTGVAFEAAGKPFTWDPVEDAKGMWKSFTGALKEEAEGATWDEITGIFKNKPKAPRGGWPSYNVPMNTPSSNVPALGSPIQRAASIKKEADAFKLLNQCVTDATQRIAVNSTVSADNNRNLQDYIRTRRESVDATVAHVRETNGDTAAQRALDAQTKTSKATLVTVLTQMGWNTAAAKVYAEKVFAIPAARETKVGLPAIKAREQELKNINTQINALVGTKTAVVKILPGSDADKKLKSLVIQQMALSHSYDFNEAKRLYEKQEKLAKMASGGPVRGNSPHPRADNIPAMLTANEYVHPVDAVKYYGTGAMDAIRQRRIPRELLQGLAFGGTVNAKSVSNRWPFGVKVDEPPGGAAFGPGMKVPGFGKWPSSAGAVHGHDSGVWRAIVSLVDRNHVPRNGYGAYNNRRTLRGGWSWHAAGRAVDFSGYNQDKLAEFFMKRKPSVLELIHSTRKRNYGVSRGHNHNMGGALYGQHKNHLHVAMADGGQVNPLPKKFDTGGQLDPGYTLAYNGTGATETVRTAEQEKNLNEPRRLDKRDIALLAQHIAAASARPIHMDGRKVAEIVYGYGYLPGGV